MSARRLSIPLVLFAVLTCASMAFFIYFGRDFPPQMAVTFTMNGLAKTYMDRVKFIVLGSFVSIMLPTFIVAVVGVLPRVLAPGRRAATLDAWLWGGLWLGCLVQILLMAMNIAIYRANLR
jgi:threonine/homoserine/homoserine lactone efflux protein